MEKSKKKVFVMGGASYDAIITLPEFPKPVPATFHRSAFKETVGSTGSGKALNLCKLGFEVNFHALIGTDWFAEQVKTAMQQPNLHFWYWQDPAGTQRHVNIMNQHGERISIFVNNSSAEPDLDYAQFRPVIAEADYVILNVTNYSRFAIPLCKELGKPIWTDLHDYDGKNPYMDDFIEASDYIFLSSDNYPDYRIFMEKMITEGKELIVCTHGKKGATALTKAGEWLEVGTMEVELLDSNGAGDAFFSGFLYGYSSGYETQKCLRLGSVSGGLCVTSPTLAHSELSESKLEAFL